MLRIIGLTKSYGNGNAVENLTLHIASGEICGFIGPNGAGKTTTIKACCGIMNFDEGEIYIDGHSIREEPVQCKRLLAYIPDEPELYGFLTGIKYLNFVANIFGVPGCERDDRIHWYADMFELTGSLGQQISSYSHGMKQKLAVIAGLIHNPRLIIMDEPFVGLDPIATHRLRDIMRQHCREGGAIFFSTHVLEVAERLCDTVAILRKGRLISSGPMWRVRGDKSLERVFLELEEQNV